MPWPLSPALNSSPEHSQLFLILVVKGEMERVRGKEDCMHPIVTAIFYSFEQAAA